MSYRSEQAAEMRSKFSHNELDNQLKRFALSSLGALLGYSSALEFSPYKPEDGNTFAFLFADSLDIRESCGNSGEEFSRKFSKVVPPNWTPNQLIHIESAIGEGTKANFNFKMSSSINEEPVFPFEIAEIRKVVARRVLHDASFQSKVALAFYMYLRTRVIMHPDGGEVPKLSIVTYWLLIHTYMDRVLAKMDVSEFQLVKTGLLNAVHHYLQSVKGWVSFWDLYVFHLLGSNGYSLPSPLEKSGYLLNSLVDGAKPRYLTGLTMRNWRKKAPKYAKYLFTSENSF